MGCNGCGGTVSVSMPSASMIRRVNQTSINCNYTQEVLVQWKTLLQCVKNTNTFDIYSTNHVRVNACLGIVQSAINYTSFPCYFAPQLDKIVPLIEAIKQNVPC